MAGQVYEMEIAEGEDKPKDSSNRTNIIFGCVLLTCFIVGIVVGMVLYYQNNQPSEAPVKAEVVPPPIRAEPLTSCQLKPNSGKQQCERLGCIWEKLDEVGSPPCRFPAEHGYTLVANPTNTTKGHRFLLRRISQNPSLYQNDTAIVKLDVEYIGERSVRIKFSDNATNRFEIPEEFLEIEGSEFTEEEDRVYNISWTTDPVFGISVIRKDNGTVVFNTSLPGFVFSDQFLQITTKLPTSNLYGFGEHNHQQLHHNMSWKRWSIFTRDVAPVDEWNLYGAQPFYLNLENSGKANGVFLKNSNAMDILLQPDPHPAVSYRVIGGVLDFYVFLGESPDHVVQLYTEAVGRPLMPPYWTLGFQLSRWDYGNLSQVEEVVRRNREAGIPQDVQYGDIDYMYKKMLFTYDREHYNGLPDFIDEIHQNGQRYIVILDHALGANETLLNETKENSPGFNAYQDGIDRDIFVKNPNGTGPLLAEVWPGLAVYPDFTDPKSQEWMTKWSSFLRINESIEYDALWIDMNEPSSFVPGSINGCDRNKWNYPPYVPNILGADDGKLFDKTICMDAQQAAGAHYNVHNLYGHTMSMRTYRALQDMFPDKRPFVLTRSNFAGTQKYAIHWLGDNQSQWRQIPWSIVAMLEYSIFGFSMTGSDICGFWYATDEEMCTRWSQLGAFYPFSRNHNAQGFRPQDPASFSDDMVRSTRSVLQVRYKFLPFLYTLLYKAHSEGSTVARPLFFEFPTDPKTFAIDRQFMWGSGLMISPVMEKGQHRVEAYFPNARWYDYFTGDEVDGTGKIHVLDAPLDKINIHVMGGNVIPWQEPDNTTVFSRQRPMGLLIALDSSHTAMGELFWDDGESEDTVKSGEYLHLEFTVKLNGLKIKVNGNYTGADNLYFQTIDIFGLSQRPNRVYTDGKAVESHYITNYNGHGSGVQIQNQKLKISVPHTISWEIF